jgi:hypothetical protein
VDQSSGSNAIGVNRTADFQVGGRAVGGNRYAIREEPGVDYSKGAGHRVDVNQPLITRGDKVPVYGVSPHAQVTKKACSLQVGDRAEGTVVGEVLEDTVALELGSIDLAKVWPSTSLKT